MQQMMERLLAKMDANQAEMKAMQQKRDINQAKMIASQDGCLASRNEGMTRRQQLAKK
jgi:hypothetical protein